MPLELRAQVEAALFESQADPLLDSPLTESLAESTTEDGARTLAETLPAQADDELRDRIPREAASLLPLPPTVQEQSHDPKRRHEPRKGRVLFQALADYWRDNPSEIPHTPALLALTLRLLLTGRKGRLRSARGIAACLGPKGRSPEQFTEAQRKSLVLLGVDPLDGPTPRDGISVGRIRKLLRLLRDIAEQLEASGPDNGREFESLRDPRWGRVVGTVYVGEHKGKLVAWPICQQCSRPFPPSRKDRRLCGREACKKASSRNRQTPAP